MRVSATIVALATTLALGSATKINMSCKFAADHTGMVQEPYCCRDLKPALNNAKVNEARDCKVLKQPQLCEDQSRPACCYEIGPKKICTSHVIFQNADDV
ncbi:uncharacterized protein N7469_010749 [Penicillium citrinum]|uniref:Uncharacterized protein n=2 Tax=Penicillium TaxID=5073 RepID=A0A9W9NKX0_PENCI|nr:uncharacterized protein N7469_010749 [Penicillium citrinum]KAJ5221862.1 hypothetical protein N7469_010749 [Penicillium citrinum]KAJ5596833.1 hypothetical protein N7450_003291 [Penicillium hetheringtonii]